MKEKKNLTAVIAVDGKQSKVAEGQSLLIDKQDFATGTKISFDQVLLVADGDKVEVGTPYVAGAKVEAEVLEAVKGDKVVVFKKKRRKGYAVKKGHRKHFIKIVITNIITN